MNPGSASTPARPTKSALLCCLTMNVFGHCGVGKPPVAKVCDLWPGERKEDGITMRQQLRL